MGQIYSQLSLDERVEIYHHLENGEPLRAIGRLLGRSASTISRELTRNGQAKARKAGRYFAADAHRRAMGRRQRDKRFKLARQPSLRTKVRDYLAMGWSPAQISGRLAQEQGAPVISHESIYRYAYHRSSDNYKDYWCRDLPQRKYRRGKIRRGNPKPLQHLQQRTSIHDRPQCVQSRCEPGHWEVDLMLFSTYGENLIVSCERRTRLITLIHPKDRTAHRVAHLLLKQFRKLPYLLRRSVTFDNGTEFAQHTQLIDAGVQTYFCDIRAPWQKGSVENAIGRLRRFLPCKTKLKDLTAGQLNKIASLYNNTPRKCLGYKTPKEAYDEIFQRVALQM